MKRGDKYDIDMSRVADLVNEAGVFAYVEHTGGGNATIYAGEPREVQSGEYTDKFYPAIAGAGSFAFQPPVWATLTDFSIGVDDQGEGGYITPMDVGAFTEEDVAKLIVAQAKKDFVLLDTDEVEALGFDGTGRSTPAEVLWEQERSSVGNAAYNKVNAALHESGEWSSERSQREGGVAREAAVTEWDKYNPRP